MEMNIKEILKNYALDFDKDLKVFLNKRILRTKLDLAIRYSLTIGGKRIRPVIVRLVSESLGLKKSDYKQIALASELLHTYSLVHDDLPQMDNDDYRRGKLATHKKFDDATAILSGNSMFSMAVEVLTKNKNNQNHKRSLEIINLLTKIAGTNGLALGQSLDLEIPKKNFSKNKIIKIYELKTSRLFEFCILSPIILAGSNKKLLNEGKLYSKNLGLIFQITDDILDAKSNFKTLGKKTNKDIKKNHLLSHISFDEACKICTDLIYECTDRKNFFGEKNPFFKKFLNFLLERKY
jgi:geranylgeranyl diphosphate synthase type II|tara:strand:+ start:738 stop:1619 length:882 start_codon:yes stop_codon:yes gene_type:complete